MIGIAPATLGKALGLRKSIVAGSLIYALGLALTAFAHVPKYLVLSTLVTSLGCICIPALIAFIANQAASDERGAVLGGIETLNELTLAIAHSGYGRTLALFISDKAPMKLPGAPFLLASACMLGGLGIVEKTIAAFPAAAAGFLK